MGQSTTIGNPSPAKSPAAVDTNDILEDIMLDTLSSLNDSYEWSSDIKISKDSLEDPIEYNAKDSMILDYPAKKVYLYGNAEVKYQDITLKANYVEYDFGKSEVYAIGGIKDSSMLLDKIIFLQGEDEYLADELRFNLKTKKAKSKGLITKQLEGYLHGMEVKAINDSILFGKNARYTTCEYEHPDYYFEIGKAKIIKDKLIVGKPVNLVVADVRTPLVLPFGIFPLKKNRVSGLLLPRWGESQELGFYLQDGGYYWVINDYLDLTTTGTIYTYGSWAVNTGFNYRKNYKYNGSLNMALSRTKTGEKRDPNYIKPGLDFFVNWNMTLDQKRMNNSSFGVSVYAGTRTFHKNNTSDAETFLSNTYRSSVSYSKWWPGKPFRLSVGANHTQTTDIHRINIQLPVLNFSVARVNPFQRKISTGGKKWYENIGFSYTLDARNELNTLDSLLKDSETYRHMTNGISQQVPVSTNFKLFKYINVSPSFNYNERWYFNTINKRFVVDTIFGIGDTTIQSRIVTDTINKFKTERDFSLNASMSYRIFGTFQFKKGKLQAIRHIVTPSLSFSYRPNFTKEHWGYFKTVQADTSGKTNLYSIFENGIYGGPPTGKVGGVGFSLGNSIEIKVYSKKDTITHSKKISIFDNLSISSFYNFAVDSFRLSPISFSGHTNIVGNYLSMNFNGSLDPYYTDPNTNRRISDFGVKVEGGKFLRLSNFSLSMNGSFSSKKNKQPGYVDLNEQGVQYNQLPYNGIYSSNVGYVNFDIPWGIRYDYSLSIRKFFSHGKDTVAINQTIGMNIDFSLTPKWKVTVSGGYDFTNKTITRTDIGVIRDLHCWQLAFNWIPIGAQSSYSIVINVKAQMLQQLRLSKRKGQYDYLGGGFSTFGE